MMNSQFPPQTLARIQQCGVIAVLQIDDAQHAVPLARALLSGGVEVMELTLRTPAALEALRRIRTEAPQMLAGVGTILSPEQVVEVKQSGGAFGVSPGLNRRVVEKAREVGLPFAPGIMTPSELEGALELGCREVKFFPAEPAGGLEYLKALATPYAHLGVQFIPLGGLNRTNMTSYLSNPLVLAIGGSWIAPRQVVQNQQWQTITANAGEASAIARQQQQQRKCACGADVPCGERS